ncbi:site-specific DNA-methyltransferase [Mycoplasma sp. 527]
MRERERERERELPSLDKYDVIYIDPPYNTESTKKDGNSIADNNEDVKAKKFIYRDKYSRNGWLNLMNERLRLAKELLKDDGVIFVSIDDAEQGYLKVLMDEIFGEENFVCNFIWEKNYSPKSNNHYVSVNHDYILCYLKNKQIVTKFNRLERNEKNNKMYKFSDEKGRYKIADLTRNSNNKFDIVWNKKVYKCPENSGWLFSEKKIYELIRENKIYLPDDATKRPGLKRYLSDVRDIISKTILGYEIVGHTQDSKNEIRDILYKNAFETPKPIKLIKYLIRLHSDKKNIRVLDFFAGSGTTAHAVLELNREDGGNRTFTLVTNNENNIGIDVNYERLYRINHGVGTKNEAFEWTKKNEPYKANLNVFNIKYYDVSPSNNDINIEDLTNKLINVLKEFGITSIDKNNQQQYINLLNDLSSLKPEKREDNESN